jgi:glycosyltransferase involved in cell wall biosynthesis
MLLDIGLNPPSFFSIILPTFNRAHLIARAIESALAQSFRNFELLIVDDGSTDETWDVVSEDVRKDSRLRYHFATNRGLAVARNLGIAMSRGEYVTFLDSDDEYLPEHLTLRAAYLQENPNVDLLHSGIEIVGDEYVADKHDPTKRIHLSECVVGGTFVVRKELALKLGGYRDVPYGDDTDFFERALRAGAVIQKVEYPTYRYYRNEADSLCAIVEREGIEGIARYRNQAV